LTGEIDALVSALNIASKQASEYLDQALKPLGLTASNYYFILKIARANGATQDQLFQLIYLTQSNITRRLAQLIQQGLVAKHRDPNDGRAWVVELTAAGKELVPRLEKGLAKVNQQVFAKMSAAQREELARLLQQVNENLAE
jgi:MarR family transcriptional regulator for hemolysin